MSDLDETNDAGEAPAAGEPLSSGNIPKTRLPPLRIPSPDLLPPEQLLKPAEIENGFPLLNPISPPSPTRMLWDQQPKEPDTAFTWFCAYRDLDPEERSIDVAFVRATGRDPWSTINRGRAPGHWYEYSRRYNWVQRVKAYDLYQERVRVVLAQRIKREEEQKLDGDRKKFRRNEVACGNKAMARAFEILSLPLVTTEVKELRDGKTIIYQQNAAPPALYVAAATLISTGSKIGRQGLGMKEDDGGRDVTPEDFKQLMFKSAGEIEAAIPKGAMQPVPLDTRAKPEFTVAGRSGGNGESNDGSGVVPGKLPRERP